MSEPKKRRISSKDHWSVEFKELDDIHFRLNSYFTFLSSRKHIITTFELLKDSAEKAIKRDLELIDVARIKYLVPEDIVFDYFDENQFVLEDKRFSWENGYQQKETDIYEIKEDGNDSGRSKQLLVFEFIDGDLKKSKTTSLYKGPFKVPTYRPESIKYLIIKRNNKFEEAINRFLKECQDKSIDDPWKELTESATKFIPNAKSFMDPIEEMMKNGNGQNTDSSDRLPITKLIQKFKKSSNYKQQIVPNGEFFIAPKTAVYGDLDFELSPHLAESLQLSKGIDRFYIHQAQAINAIHSGKDIIVSTSTSSGKSLIYQVPVIEALENNTSVTAMYIFPTKALAQDQKRSLSELLTQIPGLRNIVVDTYDGDTVMENRRSIRTQASIIFTNPDMLHSSILPSHEKWRNFLINLRYVVIDELHMYKGLFGSHVALVMRRLRRVCAMLGNDKISFVSCSATLKNPAEHMHNIFGIEEDTIVHIHEDGAPSGGKHLVCWNPPLIDPREPTAGRENFIIETARVLVTLMKNNVRTIAFCVVRKVCELLMKEVRHLLTGMERQDLIKGVMSYRGGYSVSDRREIEKQMFNGNLKVIISTNALELGIDIGSLDAVVMCGFPISISNFHQQSGRAGRRTKDSLTMVIAGNDPVNQHFMKHPERLIDMEYPELPLDFDNLLVLAAHLQCAAYEFPISILPDDLKFEERFFGHHKNFINIIKEKLQYDVSDSRYHCNVNMLPWPSGQVNIRAIEEDIYAVVDITNGRNVIIEEIEASRTSFTLYDGAIFIHQGLPYLVREFNPDDRYAKVERVNVDWVTAQRDFTDVDPHEIEKIRSINLKSDVPVYFGSIVTTIVVFGYFKMDRNNKIMDAVEVTNPPVVLHSKGIWMDIPKEAIDIINLKNLNLAAGIHAAQHAVINIFPLFIVSGVDEIQTECKAPEKEFAKRQSKRRRPARLIFFDNKGGQCGSGLSTKAFDHIDEVLEKALKNTLDCDCDWGCPQCVAATFCKENSLVLSKPAAIVILCCLLGKKLKLDTIPMGPEPNMPAGIDIETIEPVNEIVKFSDDVEIIDIRDAKAPLNELPPKDEEIEIVKVLKAPEPIVKVKQEEE